MKKTLPEPHKSLFKSSKPSLAALSLEGRRQHRLKLRKEWKAQHDLKP